MTVNAGLSLGVSQESFVLLVSGRPVTAILTPHRGRTLVNIAADLCHSFHRAGLRFDGHPYLGALIHLDALARDFEVWAGRFLRADIEVGADLAAELRRLPRPDSPSGAGGQATP